MSVFLAFVRSPNNTIEFLSLNRTYHPRQLHKAIAMCLECLVGVESQSTPDSLVRVDSHSDVQGRVLSEISKDEAMEFAPVGTYPSTGIDVLIVGTGFGGLTAALEFTRKGHNVRVLERNNEPDISGKSTTISLNTSQATPYLVAMRN